MAELLSPTQIEFRDSFRKFLAQEVPAEVVRKSSEGQPVEGLSQKISQFGISEFFLTAPSEGGAYGRDLGMVAEESGRALLPTALLDEIVSGPWFLSRILRQGRMESLRQELEALGARELAVAVGKCEAIGSLAPLSQGNAVGCRVRGGAGVRLSGTSRFVPVRADNDYLIVPAVDASGAQVVAFVPTKIAGKDTIVTEPELSLDRTIARQKIRFDGAPCITLDAAVAEELRLVEAIVRANELAGIAARVVQMTNDYVKTRKQFGVAIGSFQAVQHKLADAFLGSEAASSLAGFAAWAIDFSPDQVPFAARAALLFAVDHVPTIVETAVQLHGGIGFTWEYDLHLFLRRVKMIEALYRFSSADEESLLAAAG